MVVEREGYYEFSLRADDGAVLEIDGKPVLDAGHSLLQEEKSDYFPVPRSPSDSKASLGTIWRGRPRSVHV